MIRSFMRIPALALATGPGRMKPRVLLLSVLASVFLVSEGQFISRGCRADVCFIMDESGSIGLDDFTKQLEFVAQFVGQLAISPVDSNVALVKFATAAELVFGLATHGTSEAASQAVINVGYGTGATKTSAGLRLARQEVFMDGAHRPDAPNIAIVLTDGGSNRDAAQTIPEADALRAAGVTVLAIGIGPSLNQPELEGIAGPSGTVFNANDFDALLQDVTLLLGQTCALSSDCVRDQLSDLDTSGVYPVMDDCPHLVGPELLLDTYIEFYCDVNYTNPTADSATFEVSFLFNGDPDPAVPSIHLPDGGRATLHERYLHGHLGKWISCRVKAYWARSPGTATKFIISNSYWAGIEPSVKYLALHEDDDEYTGVLLISTLPVPCATYDSNATPPANGCRLEVEVEAEVAVVFQRPPAGTLADNTTCVYSFVPSFWNATLKQAFSFQYPLEILAKADAFNTGTRWGPIRLHVDSILAPKTDIDGNTYTDPWSGYDIEDILLENADAIGGMCSSTGDPRMTTFDRRPYSTASTGVFQMVKSSSSRDFEVQIENWRCKGTTHPCSVTCGVAVTESGAIYAISMCPDNDRVHIMQLTRQGFSYQPITRSVYNPSSYMIEMPSGARVRVSVFSWGLGVTVEVPARDRGRVQGLCGNLDGDPNNDINSSISQFVKENRVQRNESLFYDQNLIDRDVDELCDCTLKPNDPQFQVVCDASVLSDPLAGVGSPDHPVPALFPPWILDQGNNYGRRRRRRQAAEDDVIGPDDISEGYVDRDPEELDWDPPTLTWPTPSNQTEESVRSYCRQVIEDSSLYSACDGVLPAADIDIIVNKCVDDIQLMDDLAWAQDKMAELRDFCIFHAFQQNITDGSGADVDAILAAVRQVAGSVCPAQCTGQGNCTDGVCDCSVGFVGYDCSLAVGQPPTVIKQLGPVACDVTERSCSSVRLLAKDLADTERVICQVTTETTSSSQYVFNGTILTHNEVECPLPALGEPANGNALYRYSVSLSNNGVGYSAPSSPGLAGVTSFITFDGKCLDCSVSDRCTERSDICKIGGKCYDPGDFNPEKECQWCDTNHAQYSWAFNPTSGHSEPKYLGNRTVFIKVQGKPMVVQLNGTQPDGSKLNFSLVATQPAGHDGDVEVSIDGELSWAAGKDANISISVEVQDDCGATSVVDIELYTTPCKCLNDGECIPLHPADPWDGHHICVCDAAFTGVRCETNIYDCVENPCLNGATCRKEGDTVLCHCTDDYRGDNCSERLPEKGTWSSWSNYTACSKSCDNGLQQRQRDCLRDPCQGPPTETRLCAEDACPVGNQGSGGVFLDMKADMLEVVMYLEDIRIFSLNSVNEYCRKNLGECCISLNYREANANMPNAYLFDPHHVVFLPGYPIKISHDKVRLLVTVVATSAALNAYCGPRTTRYRRQATSPMASDMRTMHRDTLTKALAQAADSIEKTLNIDVEVHDGTDDTQLIAILAGTIGSLFLVLIIITIVTVALKNREKKLTPYDGPMGSWKVGAPRHPGPGGGRGPASLATAFHTNRTPSPLWKF